MAAHQVGERAFRSERQAIPAEVHELEDLGWIDALGSRHVVEQAQRGVTLCELLENASVLDVAELANAEALAAD
jgi:hypothetical protein